MLDILPLPRTRFLSRIRPFLVPLTLTLSALLVAVSLLTSRCRLKSLISQMTRVPLFKTPLPLTLFMLLRFITVRLTRLSRSVGVIIRPVLLSVALVLFMSTSLNVPVLVLLILQIMLNRVNSPSG